MTARRTALLLSGGPHPFAETTPLVEALLADAGYEVQVVESPAAAAALLESADPDIWVCNTLRWRMLAPKYDDIRDEFAHEIDEGSAARIEAWVRGGGWPKRAPMWLRSAEAMRAMRRSSPASVSRSASRNPLTGSSSAGSTKSPLRR